MRPATNKAKETKSQKKLVYIYVLKSMRTQLFGEMFSFYKSLCRDWRLKVEEVCGRSYCSLLHNSYYLSKREDPCLPLHLRLYIRELKQKRQRWQRKCYLSSEFALFQTSSPLFYLMQFVKCWLLKLNSCIYILSFTHHLKMSSRLVRQDFTYILSFRNSTGKVTAQQLIITFYVRRLLHDIFAFIQSSRKSRIASELRYMVPKVCMVIVIIIFTSFLVG